MSKKTNTFLFILGATVFNVIITIVCFSVFFVLFFAVLQPRLGFGENAVGVAVPVIFVLAIVASFFLYRLALNLVTRKVDMDKYFDPLFGRGYKKR